MIDKMTPELRIFMKNDNLEVHILNAPQEDLSDMMCNTVTAVVERGLCKPDYIVSAVTEGLLKAKEKVEIGKISLKEKIQKIALNTVKVLSIVGTILYFYQGNVLMGILLAGIAVCFVLANNN